MADVEKDTMGAVEAKELTIQLLDYAMEVQEQRGGTILIGKPVYMTKFGTIRAVLIDHDNPAVYIRVRYNQATGKWGNNGR